MNNLIDGDNCQNSFSPYYTGEFYEQEKICDTCEHGLPESMVVTLSLCNTNVCSCCAKNYMENPNNIQDCNDEQLKIIKNELSTII